MAYLRGSDRTRIGSTCGPTTSPRSKHALLVDSARLVPRERALSAEEEARRERQRTSSLSGIVEYEFSPDSQSLLVPLGGDCTSTTCARSPQRPCGGSRRRESYETDARFSPRGRYVSFVRDQNLVVNDLASGKERAVTRDGGGLVSFGMAEFIAQEEMDRDTGYWWSPDERTSPSRASTSRRSPRSSASRSTRTR